MKKQFLKIKKEDTLKIKVFSDDDGRNRARGIMFSALGITAPNEQKVARYLVEKSFNSAKGHLYNGSLRNLAEDAKVSLKQVQNALEELKKLGLVTKERNIITIDPDFVSFVSKFETQTTIKFDTIFEFIPRQTEFDLKYRDGQKSKEREEGSESSMKESSATEENKIVKEGKSSDDNSIEKDKPKRENKRYSNKQKEISLNKKHYTNRDKKDKHSEK